MTIAGICETALSLLVFEKFKFDDLNTQHYVLNSNFEFGELRKIHPITKLTILPKVSHYTILTLSLD